MKCFYRITDHGGVWLQTIYRFLVGGAVVSVFALLGTALKPASFAGLFGAAPSVALATLGLTIAKEGSQYASVECRSMIAGAVALLVYSLAASRLMMVYRFSAIAAASLSMVVWLGCAFLLWIAFLR